MNAPTKRPHTYDHRDNAGEWEHDDGTPCPYYWSDKPAGPDGTPWWCTTHQQRVHVRAAS